MTEYEAKLNSKPDVRGWSWKQIVLGSAALIAIAIRDLAQAVREGEDRTP